MAADIKMSRECPFSLETYIDLFFGEACVERVRETGVYRTYEVERLTRGERWTRRELVMAPKHEMPVWVKRVIGNKDVTLVERADYLHGGQVIELEWVPNILKGQISAKGTLRLEPLGEARCRSELEMRVAVSMFGFGGRMEPRFAEAIERTYGHRETLMLAMAEEG